jgi:hypothetical protein
MPKFSNALKDLNIEHLRRVNITTVSELLSLGMANFMIVNALNCGVLENKSLLLQD